MSRPDPNAKQREAADAGASVWVAASAGTGKTKILTDRVLALMLKGSLPQRILCLTFTKAAAAEMSIRLSDRLSRWATEGDGKLTQELQALTGKMPTKEQLAEARRLFARMLDAPGGMRIDTIHAFCQSVLRRFPIEAGIAPHFEVMDERSEAEALTQARTEVLEDSSLADALAEITRQTGEGGFAELMKALAGERARLSLLLADGVEPFLAELRRLLGVALGTTAATIVAAACSGFDDGMLLAAARALSESGSKQDGERAAIVLAWLENPGRRAERFEEYTSFFFTAKGDPRAKLCTASFAKAQPQLAAVFEEEARRVQEVVRQRQTASLFAATAALIRLGDALLRVYARHKEQRALLDYDDLVLGTRDLLRRPGVAPWVLFKLDGGLDHILIDEAQDTNPEQWEVVEALAEEFFSGAGARDQERTIFAVGDVKQSIFSFQRADPSAFMRMREHFAQRIAKAKWRVVDLDISFRSVPAVLKAVDLIFGRPEAGEGVVPPGTVIRHEAFRAGMAGLTEIWPPILPDEAVDESGWEPVSERRRARAPQARLARAIAARIANWIAGGERLEARGRPVRAGDFLVLVRRRNPFVPELVRALKEVDVPVAGADRMILTDQLAVEDMMALAQFLLLPEDDLTLATVLKGPLFDFDDDLLFDLAYTRGERSLWRELRRRAGEQPSFARADAELAGLLGRADFMPPYELFAEVLSARGGRQAILRRLGPDAADPLDELLASALAYERMHGPSLQGFLAWLSAGEAEIKRDLDQRGRNEVRIMTVHGAKGLQAPIVFLPDTLGAPLQTPRLLWTEGGMPLWAGAEGGSSHWDLARQAAQTRRDQEYRRLLYVALTRAEDRLYVCGWQTKKAPPAGNWYELVKAGLKAAPGVEEVAIDLGEFAGADGWAGTGLRLSSAQSEAVRTDTGPAAEASIESVLPIWARAEPLPEPSPPRPLAPSRPASEDPAARSPLVDDDRNFFQRGRLVHRLLQSLPELAPEARISAARRFLALSAHDLSADAQEALLRETMAVLDHPDFAPLFAAGSRAEVPIVAVLGDRAISGQIDRLVVLPDQIMIVDYKTLRPPPRDIAEVPASYLDQLAAYRAAISAIYPGRRVKAALLWTEGPRLMPIDEAHLDAHAPSN